MIKNINKNKIKYNYYIKLEEKDIPIFKKYLIDNNIYVFLNYKHDYCFDKKYDIIDKIDFNNEYIGFGKYLKYNITTLVNIDYVHLIKDKLITTKEFFKIYLRKLKFKEL